MTIKNNAWPNWTAAAVAACLLAATGCSTQSREPVLAGEPRLRVAQAAEEAGDLDLAEQLYAGSSASSPRDAAVQLRYADLLARRGRIAEARDLLDRHMGTVTDPLLLRTGSGSLYILTGEPKRAVTEFDAVLASRPSDARARLNKAVALDLLHQHADAQALYLTALAEAPKDPIVLNNLALSLLLSGRLQEAAIIVAQIEGRRDVRQRIRTGMGVVLAANGDMDGARRMTGLSMDDAQLVELATAAKSPASY